MIIINEKWFIHSILQRWDAQYSHLYHTKELLPNKKTKLQIRKELQLLDLKVATIDDISCIIGNDSWIKEYCSECETWSSNGIIVGESIFLCAKCIGKIIAMVNKGVLK